MCSSQEMWKLVFRALIQETHGRAWVCMSFPIKMSWDRGIRHQYFLCSSRWGCPMFFHVLHLLGSLLHTEHVQGHAGVCKLEMKPNLQTSVFAKNTVGLWLSSWFCFMSARCWCFCIAAKPLASWAALAMWASADQLEEALLGNNESTCEVWMEIHTGMNQWKFMLVFWILGGSWEMPSLPALLQQQPGMLEGCATSLLPLSGLGYACVIFKHPFGL